MRSPIVQDAAADKCFTEELRLALRRQGLRGAVAQEKLAEGLEHYLKARQGLSAAETVAKVGTPHELAVVASRDYFKRKFWCAYPVLFGMLAGGALLVVACVASILPIYWATKGPYLGFMEAYVWSFNWFGPIAMVLLAAWATGRTSLPPLFRGSLLLVFSPLVLVLLMRFSPPLAGPGTGSFDFGTWFPDVGPDGQPFVWGLILLRVITLAVTVRRLGRSV